MAMLNSKQVDKGAEVTFRWRGRGVKIKDVGAGRYGCQYAATGGQRRPGVVVGEVRQCRGRNVNNVKRCSSKTAQ